MSQVFDSSTDKAEVLPAVVRADDDYLTVTMVSAGLASLLARRQQVGQGDRNDGLLPAPWRIAFTRIWWRCQEQGVPAPESDLELLTWCTHPMITWRVSLALSEQDLQNCLVFGEELSGFAEQGARLAVTDVEAEWREQRVYHALRTAATANGGDDDEEVSRIYAVLRRRLIDHPVLTDREVKRWEREYPRADASGQTHIQRLIHEGYVSRSVTGTHEYRRCPDCRNTVLHESTLCQTAGCPAGKPETIAVQALAVVYDQHRATRRFIHDPGLVEARIMDALTTEAERLGHLRVTPYPNLDTLDILIEFLIIDAEGREKVTQTWGVDAKDQQSARLLGRGFAWPASIHCDRRFLAIPMHRKILPGYVDDLVAELDGRVTNVEVVDEQKLLSMVKATARGLTR